MDSPLSQLGHGRYNRQKSCGVMRCGAVMRSDAGRYDSVVDLSAKNTSHAQLVLLTGRNKKVLEIGPATGYVTEVLRSRGCEVTAIEMDPGAAEIAAEFCERIIVGDVEQIDFPQTFRDEQFDVVMFGDVLEHLVDPRGILEKVRPLLRAGGYVVASIPNVAHGSIRLMLLDGKFAYSDKGLLDHTHLRFFTKRGIEGLFEEAGYRIRVWRHMTTDTLQDPFAGEFSSQESELPTHLVEALRQDPEALTYQFVVRAYPRRARRLNKRGSQRVPESTDGVGNAVKALWHLEEVLARKDQNIAQKDATLAVKDAALSEKNALLTDKDALLAEKDALLTEKDTSLAEKDILLTEKDTLLTEKDASLTAKDAHLRDLQVHYQLAIGSLGYRLLERARRVINWLAPLGTRRRGVLKLPRKGLRIVRREGWGAFLRRVVPVWRWAPRLLAPGSLVEAELPLDHQYQFWLQAHALTPARTTAILREATRLSYRPQMSVILPVYNPDLQWLRDAIESVRAQLYDNWELCIADDGSSNPGVRAVLEDYARADERIKVTYLKENKGISAASNRALGLATGEFVGLLDHDDELKPDALYEVVKLLNEQPDLDFIYTDEDKRRPDGRLGRPFFKPDWSPDLLLSVNYVPHFAVYRKRMVEEVGGLRSECDLSQDYDLALRVAERTDHIGHIPLPLYTWRMAAGSASATHEDKLRAMKSAKRALAEAIQRRGIEADILDGSVVTTYRVRYRIQGQPLVSIIIPTRDRIDLLRRCITSIEMKSTYCNYEIVIVDNDSKEEVTFEYLNKLPHRCVAYPGTFNYAAMTNFAVGEAAGEYVLFLNNDTEVITGEWIEAMLEHGQRPEVAAVGTRLLYPDGRPQHEGIIIGLGGSSAGNVNHGGYFGLDELVHNVSAVTGACMMTRRDVFDRLGGFEENLGVAFNDVDYCLRAREQGYLIVYTPYAVLYHHESGTRGKLHPMEDELFFRQRWGKPGQYRDPYYNPNLSLTAPFAIKLD